MAFKMPTDDQIRDEQWDVINLKRDKPYVIIGSPGTGKTVMAVYRAAQMPYAEVPLLVYNRPLADSLKGALTAKKYSRVKPNTYHNWLWRFYKFKLNIENPAYEGVNDMTKVAEKLNRIMDDRQGKPFYDHIIVDEAQDFPEALINVLTRLAGGKITFFADPHQRVIEGMANTMVLLNAINKDTPREMELNHRNTIQVRDASSIFCDDDTAPAYRKGNKPVIKFCRDKADQTAQILALVTGQKKGKSVGIIVDSSSSENVLDMYDNLREGLVNAGVPLQMYVSDPWRLYNKHPEKAYLSDIKKDLNFECGGVVILSYLAMKGLEFDTVILPDFDRITASAKESGEVNMNRIYVGLSRAWEDAYIFTQNRCPLPGYVDAMGIINLDGNRPLFQW